MAATKTQIYKKVKEPTRLTFWLSRPIVVQLKKNAKEEELSFPDYLAFLVQRGLTANGKRVRL